MTKLADPHDIASKKIFSKDNIEDIKDFADSIQLCLWNYKKAGSFSSVFYEKYK
jgi:hypothetical protein